MLSSLLIFPYVYPVDSIACVSQFGECKPHIKHNLEAIEGYPLKKAELAIADYLSSDYTISEFATTYKPLARLEVNMVQEKAEIAVRENSSDKFFLVSLKGEKISESSESALPKVFIARDEINFDSPQALFAVKLLRELYIYYDINEIVLDESSLKTVYRSDLEVTFPVDGDIDVLLGSMELLLFQLKRSLPDTKITSIDLRYKNPVVK